MTHLQLELVSETIFIVISETEKCQIVGQNIEKSWKDKEDFTGSSKVLGGFEVECACPKTIKFEVVREATLTCLSITVPLELSQARRLLKTLLEPVAVQKGQLQQHCAKRSI